MRFIIELFGNNIFLDKNRFIWVFTQSNAGKSDGQ